MTYVHSDDFLAVLPLMGKDYFFPSLPLGGKSPTVDHVLCDSDDDEERDRFFASKIVSSPLYRHERAQYPDDIPHITITNFNSTNFDVVSFLSTDKRDYLVRNDKYWNSDYINRVKVSSLTKKRWVMICCFFCPMFAHDIDSLELRAVSSVCSDLYDSYGDSFEMVLVLKMRSDFQEDESAFRHFLSGFPSSCLVVPFWDSQSSNLICRSLGFTRTGEGLFLQANERKVIWHKHLGFFKSHGSDSFPFTDEIIQNICLKERLQDCQTLESLFGCPSTMVLSKNKGGETTSIEQLGEKLVGVYMCLNGDFIPMLQEIYERCKEINKPFEVVVVYCPFRTKNSDPHLFQKLINRALEKRKISWWVLPFKRWVSLRLQRVFRGCIEDELVIVGKGFAVEPHGRYVMQKFGTRAYPFSRELLFQKETERIRNLTLASLLVHGEVDYVVRDHLGGQVKVPVASLKGNNVFIYVDLRGNSDNISLFCRSLVKHYSDIKARDPELELVYVGSGATLVSSTGLPWLICPYDSHHLDFASKEIFSESKFGINTVVAVTKDGKVSSIKAHRHLLLRGVEAYPFDGNVLKQDVIDQFHTTFCQMPQGYL